MSRLFSADYTSALQHGFQHIAIPHVGNVHVRAHFLNVFMKSEIAHDCRRDFVFRQFSVVLQHPGTNADGFVSVNHLAVFVHHNQTVRISVISESDIRMLLPDLLLQFLRVGGANMIVDVDAVRRAADGNHPCAQIPVNPGSDLVGRTVGAVHDDSHAVKTHVNCGEKVAPVDLHGVLLTFHAGAQRFSRHMGVGIDSANDQIFDFLFNRIVQLEAFTVEEFDSVIFKRIMRCGNHDAGLCLVVTNQISYRRRGNHAHLDHIASDGEDSRRQSILQHIAGNTRIFSDDDHRVFPGFSQH